MKIDLVFTTEEDEKMSLGHVVITMSRSKKLIRRDINWVERKIAGAVVKEVHDFGHHLQFALLRDTNMRIDCIVR